MGGWSTTNVPTETRISVLVNDWRLTRLPGKSFSGQPYLKLPMNLTMITTLPATPSTSSLGQLTDYDQAYDAALKPLYEQLAIKIADYIKLAW